MLHRLLARPAAQETRQSVSIASPACRDLDTLRLSRQIETSHSPCMLEAVIERVHRNNTKPAAVGLPANGSPAIRASTRPNHRFGGFPPLSNPVILLTG